MKLCTPYEVLHLNPRHEAERDCAYTHYDIRLIRPRLTRRDLEAMSEWLSLIRSSIPTCGTISLSPNIGRSFDMSFLLTQRGRMVHPQGALGRDWSIDQSFLSIGGVDDARELDLDG